MKFKIILKTTNKYKDRVKNCLNSWLGDQDYICLTDVLTGEFNEISGSQRQDYHSAEEKTAFMFNYIKDNPSEFSIYDYVFFIDDDAILNTKAFNFLMPYLDKNKFYGLTIWGSPLGPELGFPSGGAGYFFNPRILQDLPRMTIKGHGIEDYSVGQWLHENNLTIHDRVNINQIEYHMKLNGWYPLHKYDEFKEDSDKLIDALERNKEEVARGIMSCITHHYVKDIKLLKYIHSIFQNNDLIIGA